MIEFEFPVLEIGNAVSELAFGRTTALVDFRTGCPKSALMTLNETETPK